MSIRPRTLRSSLVLSSALLLTLAACKPENGPQAAAEPLFVPADSAAYEMSVAPGWSDLPAYQAEVGRPRDDGYGYAERAYAVDRAFYQSPPDYAFAYDDARPWVWETQDDWLMYVEPLAVGYRYYYYEPGEDYPYFVRDPDYGYGYDEGGLLVVVYDSRGYLLPTTYVTRYADRGGRYLGRARALRDASVHAHRVSIPEERWVDRRSAFVGDQANWFEAAQRQPDWTRYRAKHEAKDLRRFERERERRADAVARLDRVEARQGGRGHDARRVTTLDSPPRVLVERDRRDERRTADTGPRIDRPDRDASERVAKVRTERRDDNGRDRSARIGAERPERAERRAEPARPQQAVAPPQARLERQVRLDDRKPERRAEERRDSSERPVVAERSRKATPPPARVERQARREDRNGPAADARQGVERKTPPQAASAVIRVERQARREDRGAEPHAQAPRPERQARVEPGKPATGAREAAGAGRDAAAREHGGKGRNKE
ncbi:hypothetical protein M9M90_08980 [Phenylobacterium sp. LH3H17]|uniref:hypothetical protein n=1 Tax=Phenylobacterium sp. LH3H17 TaxID=2903901 RepID=UPI0020C96ABB|nr:hypothetical protein [Phenylobacterium sp. LH3H17]UTP41291.1 hypothetical protein M9M90_08980 [Phenylobacterium sp. LH3H17]